MKHYKIDLFCGLINGSICWQLLAERTLTLKTVIDLAKTLESSEVETKLINMEIKADNGFAIKQNLENVIDATLINI